MTDWNYYKILGVGHQASPEEIKHAFRRLARKFHPDVSTDPQAEEKFKRINEAHETLGDLNRRAAYDQSLPPDMFTFFAAGVGQAGPDLEEMDCPGPMPGDPGHADARTDTRRGMDLETSVNITLAEAFQGCEREVASGRGQQVVVHIPAGTLHGQHLRLAGMGMGAIQGTPGDLLVQVRILPQSGYRVLGRDIHMDTPILPWEAALGAAVMISTLVGRVHVKLPPSACSGQKLRLQGRGLPGGAEEPGDLYLRLRIVVPQDTTDEERALYAQLARVSRTDPRLYLRPDD